MKDLKGCTPKIIGHIGVDAGIVWIGDPCYILHKGKKSPKSIGKDWGDFCSILSNKDAKSFSFDLGHEGLGVCTSTNYGDGTYPVIGFYKGDSKRPSFVIVDFVGAFDKEYFGIK